MHICETSKCTGCSSCIAVCVRGAISMIPDGHGFLYPAIDQSKCISCGLCRKACPQNHTLLPSTNQSVFAGLSTDDKLREASSSGGIFSELAKTVLTEKGLVFGAAYDADLRVHHIGISNIAELYRLRGSKYVQSYIGTAYADTKAALLQGRQVLFSGTPCQIAGLYAFLGKKYSNLLTVDILCHGVPSPAVFRTFISSLQEQYNSPIVNISFRCKTPGWKNFTTQIALQDGTKKQLPFDSYMAGFLSNVYLRESCYQCRYASTTRIGDITLGDYWGYRESAPEYIEDDDRGISLIICNTEKGYAAIKKIRKRLSLAVRSIDDPKRGNPVLSHPVKKADSSNAFWKDFSVLPWRDLSKKHFPVQSLVKDHMRAEDRKYYSIPYKKRHRRHLIHCWKASFLRRITAKK